MSNPHGVGIVGCGMIANFHAEAVSGLENARVVGATSRNPDSAAAFAHKHGCEAFDSLDAMLADDRIDVVSICTPSGAHLDPALAAAAAGKHVVIEKPLEISLARCDAIIDACDEAGVKLGGIVQSRFAPANVAIKRAIDAGRFGRLTLGDTYVKWWRPQDYYDSGGWRGTWALDGGGAYMNQAIHNVDLLLWFMGDVTEVCGLTATLAHDRIEVEDTGTAIVRFASGALGTLEATTSVHPGLLKKTEIHGDRGTAIVEHEHLLAWLFDDAADGDDELLRQLGQQDGSTGGAADPKAISVDGHRAQFANFFDAIDNDTQPLVDGREARRSVELILAIYQSQWTGQRVSLPLERDPERPTG